MRDTITFDDVLLVPKYSSILSRKQIDLSVALGKDGMVLECPFISSPMDTVTEFKMASAMAKSGGLGVIHRYNTIEEQANIAKKTILETEKVAAAIGVSGDYLERATALYECGVRIICVDVAHGHHSLMKKALSDIRNIFSDSIHIMAGNVATLDGFNDLADWGADSIRVGIGGGSICSTRIQTGHGVPTLQSVLDCSITDRDALIIADGGMKSTGDIAKAIAAGADLVMCGSMFAGTEESPGDVFSAPDGKKYKVYRGMASAEAQLDWKGEANSLEGISTTIPYKGSVKSMLSLLDQNIRSGFSYSGAVNLKDFQQKVKMIEQTQAGMKESFTHILTK